MDNPTDSRAIADRLIEDVDRDLVSRQDLDLAERIEGTAWLARQAMIEVDRMAAAHLANGGTYQQVADALGITRQSAHQRYSRRG